MALRPFLCAGLTAPSEQRANKKGWQKRKREKIKPHRQSVSERPKDLEENQNHQVARIYRNRRVSAALLE